MWWRLLAWLLSWLAACLSSFLPVSAWSQERAAPIEGFSAPFRTVNVATSEMGLVSRLDVQENQFVKAGETLAQLDTALVEASLQVAEAAMKSRGELDAAEAELRVRTQRLEALEGLLASKHARPEEVTRSRGDRDVALGNLTAAQERMRVRKLEYDRLQKQLELRTIRAPISGWVVRIHKQAGEFVGPTDPTLLTVVQIEPLVVNFQLPLDQSHGMKAGATVRVRFVDGGALAEGTVDSISPVIDAESGTIAARVLVPNANYQLRAGEQCELISLVPGNK